jgi:DNA-binding response OmpR family regulator
MHAVLIVDDDEDVRESIAEALQTMPGLLVQTASSGVEALERTRDRTFTLVLTDVQMPGITGLDLLGQLKKECPQTQVVVMSGDPISRQRGILAGADSIIEKPFGKETIAALVDAFLPKSQTATHNRTL